MQYERVMAGEVKLLSVAAAECSSRDGHQLRWLLTLTMTCIGVVLLMTLACNSMKLAMTSHHLPDVISVMLLAVDRRAIENSFISQLVIAFKMFDRYGWRCWTPACKGHVTV